MPGPITLILKKREIIPNNVTKNTIAVRVPLNDVAITLSTDIPLTATSANKHGNKAPLTITKAKKQLGDTVSMYIDGGTLIGVPSTIIDVSSNKIKILRDGLIKKEEIYECL
jgi:L-threonylcarbamoyladenylate synthase